VLHIKDLALDVSLLFATFASGPISVAAKGLKEEETRDSEVARLVAANTPVSKLEDVIRLLVELTFLGFEVAPNRFEFLYDEQDERKFSIMARKTADETTNGVRRFRIHPAFHAFLEIKPHSATTPGQMIINL